MSPSAVHWNRAIIWWVLLSLFMVELTQWYLWPYRAESERIRWFVIYFAATTHVGADKIYDKDCSELLQGREGMRAEQLLQMAAVRTDRSSITGFATYTAQGTVIKQNLQITESNTRAIYRCVIHINNIVHTIRCTQCILTHTIYTIHNFPVH